MDTYANELKKIILTDKLRPLIYDSTLGHLGVFSKQYFSSIIYSMFQDTSDKDFCFTYGDFNGLGKINTQHGTSAGDFAVEEAIRNMLVSMPEDTLFCRIAGDEFAFLTPGYTKRTMKPSLDKVHSQLNSIADCIYGLSISLSSVDNHAYEDFEDMFLHAALDVEKQKEKSRQSENSDINATLLQKCTDSFSRFFNYYRFNDTSLPEGFFSTLKRSLGVVMLSNIDNSSDTDLQRYTSMLQNSLLVKTMPTSYEHFEQTSAQTIHTLLTEKEPSKDLFEQVSYSDLNALFHVLDRHPLTLQFTQKYFDNIMLPDIVHGSEKTFTVRLFDILHMKLSNDLVGHDNTDKKMYELLSHIIDPISSKNDSNPIFAMQGCNLLLIENKDTACSNSEIAEYVEQAKQNQHLLDLVYSTTTCRSDYLPEAIASLAEACSVQKQKVKAIRIQDPKTMTLALETALKDPLTYYKTHFEQPESESSKEELLATIYSALVTVLDERFPKQYTSNTHTVISQDPPPEAPPAPPQGPSLDD